MTMQQNCKLLIKGPATVVVGSLVTGKQSTIEVDCTNGPVMFYGHRCVDGAQGVQLRPEGRDALSRGRPADDRGEGEHQEGERCLKVGFYAPDATFDVDKDASLVPRRKEINRKTRSSTSTPT
jgi:hypothetical protein